MLHWEHSGFSLHAGVRVHAFDHDALERLLRYCARPPFASENLKWNRDILVYNLSKVSQDGLHSIQLKPLEFLNKVSALIPEPNCHLQHYHGVFASNAPFRKQITAHANKLMEEHVPAIAQAPDAQKSKSSYSWAKLLARIYEVFPLICSCGEVMKIIAFITNPHTARQILAHLKFNTNPFDPLPLELEEWENGSQIPVEPEYEITQLLPGTHDGFPEIEEQVHYHAYHAGPDPPCSQLIDPPHCEYECDSPHWED